MLYDISWRHSFCDMREKEATRLVSRTNWGLEKEQFSNIVNVSRGLYERLDSPRFRGGIPTAIVKLQISSNSTTVLRDALVLLTGHSFGFPRSLRSTGRAIGAGKSFQR